jgi:hypothetical protein
MEHRITRRRSLILAGALALTVSPLAAQPSAVLLRIRPRVGDTLYTRLEQQVEMTTRR